MLRIGKLTDYALLIMSQMAKSPSTVLSATALAEILHLSVPTVSKILKMLSDNGLVNSVRGAEGGYHLALAPQQIRLVDIIASMEGEISMTECCENQSNCLIETRCTMRDNWLKINEMVHSLLSRYTVFDMLSPLPAIRLQEEIAHGE